jgi:hypothetical protein
MVSTLPQPTKYGRNLSRAYPGSMEGFKVEHLADFGSGEPWVARVFLGLGDLIAATPLNGRDLLLS